MTEKNTTQSDSNDMSFEQKMAVQESRQTFKQKVATELAAVAERIFSKAITANSENISSFMNNVAEYELSLDSVEGEFTSPSVVQSTEGQQNKNAGNGSFKLSGFKLTMKMKSNATDSRVHMT